MKQTGSNKVANSLVALSSAAVLAVYAAGYSRTRSAAGRFDAQTAERRPAAAPVSEVPATLPNLPASAVTAAPVASAGARKPVEKRVAVAAAESVPPMAAVPGETPAPAPSSAPVEAPPAVSEPAPPPPGPVAINAPPPAPAAPAAPAWKDGTYYGWGSSRHGDIQAAVVIEGGRIASAAIARCLTRYSCSVIDRLPPQVAQRQSPEVDYVSGATQSANAFYYAVVDALNQAK